MSIMSTISRLAQDFSQARTRYLTEQQINALPSDLRKDIGWPDATPSLTRRTNPLGVWSGGRGA